MRSKTKAPQTLDAPAITTDPTVGTQVSNTDAQIALAESDGLLAEDSWFSGETFDEWGTGLFTDVKGVDDTKTASDDMYAPVKGGDTWLGDVALSIGVGGTRGEDVLDDALAQTTRKVGVNTDMKSVGVSAGSASKEGDDTSAVGGGLTMNSSKVTGSTEGTMSWGKDDDSRGLKVGASVDSDGGASATVGGTMGKLEGAATGAVKITDGEIDELGLQVGIGTKDTKLSAGAKLDELDVVVEGTTVSWDQSMSASLNTKLGGVGGSNTVGQSTRQSRTFSDVATAEAFARQLNAGQTGVGVRPDAGAMGDGESASFEDKRNLSPSAGLGLVSAGGTYESSESVTMNREGDQLVVVIEAGSEMSRKVAATFGVLGADATQANTWSREIRLVVDTTRPEAMTALDALLAGGQITSGIPGFQATFEEVDSSCIGGAGELGVGKASEEVCSGTGRYDDGYGQGDLTTTNASETTERYSVSDYMPDFIESWFNTKEPAFAPTKDGRVDYDTKTYRPDGTTDEHMVMTQTFDMEDQRETARHLHDQADPTKDLAQIPDSLLPAPERETLTWMLETEVDAEGTHEVVDRIYAGAGIDGETDAILAAAALRREMRNGDKSDPEILAALAQNGGNDGIEYIRNAAGPEHTEQWLSAEGDDVFLGRAGWAELEQQLLFITQSYVATPKSSLMDIQELLGTLEHRHSRTYSAEYQAVPSAFKKAERLRLDALQEQASALEVDILRHLDSKETR